MHEATGCMLTMTSFRDGFTSFNVTFMSVSLGMWSLKSSTELTKKGMWQDNTCRCHEGNKDSLLCGVNRRIYRIKDAFWLTTINISVNDGEFGSNLITPLCTPYMYLWGHLTVKTLLLLYTTPEGFKYLKCASQHFLTNTAVPILFQSTSLIPVIYPSYRRSRSLIIHLTLILKNTFLSFSI